MGWLWSRACQSRIDCGSQVPLIALASKLSPRDGTCLWMAVFPSEPPSRARRGAGEKRGGQRGLMRVGERTQATQAPPASTPRSLETHLYTTHHAASRP